MTRRPYRVVTTVACAVAALALGLAVRAPLALDGPLLDVLIRARALTSRAAPAPASPVVVVAVDEASLETAELAPYPRALFAPVWAKLIEALGAAGARAIGFDLLFTYSASRLSLDYDAPFLAAIASHRDRVVLARSSRALPAPPFLAALDPDDHALGLAELVADADGVHRHVPRAYRPRGAGEMPSLAAAVLQRAGRTNVPDTVLLAPRHHPEAIPTFALADVLRCAEASPAALAQALSGRIVLIGSTLPDEDRKLTSARFLPPPPEGAPLAPCGLHALGASRPASKTIPGVHLHALAIDAVERGPLTRTAPAAL